MSESNPKTAKAVVEQRGEGSAFLEMPKEKRCAVERAWRKKTAQTSRGGGLRQHLTKQAGDICEITHLGHRHSIAQALTSGAFSPACNSDSVPSSPQLWSLQQSPMATVLAAILEVEAWVLVGTVATPSPPAVGTAWARAQVWEALVSPPVAAGARWAVAPASSSFPPHHAAGKVTSTKAASLRSPLPYREASSHS